MDYQTSRKIPKRKDDRVILQFDYDCFYAQVFENRNPALRAEPLGVRQKNILATCNYNARRLGVRKLMLVSEAKKLCPNLILVDGEDLTPFRDTSKLLFNFLRSRSWNNKVERLGFDEVFMDVTDIIDYNLSCINKSSLDRSFFQISREDPLQGFECDLTSIAGCTEGDAPEGLDKENHTYLRLLLGSHLGLHLRRKLEDDFGYTSTCGISTNKLLSKLVGARNKPRNQTTLLALSDERVAAFMDAHELRKIPGIGTKTADILEAHVTAAGPLDSRNDDLALTAEAKPAASVVTAGQVRQCSSLSPGLLESLLGGPGAEKGVGGRVWGLLHGVEPAEIREASDYPSQISIEDTYKGLKTLSEITHELKKLSGSLLRRMRIDLVVDADDEHRTYRWLAKPKTLRLTIRSWPPAGVGQSQNFSRVSRSGPLPSFVFDTGAEVEHLAERLVAEALLPLFQRFPTEKSNHWNLQLINICVANLAPGAADDKTGAGRDIALMFRRQDEALRPWRVVEDEGGHDENDTHHRNQESAETDEEDEEDDSTWGGAGVPACPICGHSIPQFAQAAHARFHELDD
ncbi:hypothetical protein B0I35DRAFT_477645 [Stachybotrys elegans]|uniref:UmuC domain-containing protein n=1 Tax=Stachybotrys elegans TaxID=80388 RepID=A0A8K0SUE7_9HYPO|nr:hypothetical protein B0I35DRAFT_477645 [Stachybotrys elegans]